MTKMPPSFMPYHPKKNTRLHFPQYGDSNIFSKCGRKHFLNSYLFSNPFASYSQQADPANLKHQYLKDSSAINHGKQLGSRNQQKLHRYSKFNEEQIGVSNQKEQLQRQLFRFNSNKSSNHLELKSVNFYSLNKQPKNIQQYQPRNMNNFNQNNYPSEPQRMRIKTEAQYTYDPQRQSSSVTHKRIKSQPTEPGTIKVSLVQPRFNPTYLSSINY